MKKRPTLKDHQEIQAQIRRFQCWLAKTYCRLANAYPFTAKCVKSFRSIDSKVNLAKYDLENQAFKDHPTLTLRELYHPELDHPEIKKESAVVSA